MHQYLCFSKFGSDPGWDLHASHSAVHRSWPQTMKLWISLILETLLTMLPKSRTCYLAVTLSPLLFFGFQFTNWCVLPLFSSNEHRMSKRQVNFKYQKYRNLSRTNQTFYNGEFKAIEMYKQLKTRETQLESWACPVLAVVKFTQLNSITIKDFNEIIPYY